MIQNWYLTWVMKYNSTYFEKCIDYLAWKSLIDDQKILINLLKKLSFLLFQAKNEFQWRAHTFVDLYTIATTCCYAMHKHIRKTKLMYMMAFSHLHHFGYY